MGLRRNVVLVLVLAAVGVGGMAAMSPKGNVAERSNAPAKSSSGKSLGEHEAMVADVRGELERLAQDAAAIPVPESRRKLAALADKLKSLERPSLSTAPEVPAPNVAAPQTHQSNFRPAPPPDHPFLPAIDRARQALSRIERIADYSAVLTKRERIRNTLGDYEYMFVKIRHRPFSVYLRFLAPDGLAGREVIYVEGKNDGQMFAHEAEGKGDLLSKAGRLLGVGTARLDPRGLIAMRGNRYPITEIGILNLTRRLIEVGEQDMQHGDAEAKHFPNAKVNDRRCEAWVFTHPVRREPFRFHRAEVFIDKELELPIRYASYEWPAPGDDKPVLLEEYTYTKIKLDQGFTDADFDVANPQYKFPK